MAAAGGAQAAPQSKHSLPVPPFLTHPPPSPHPPALGYFVAGISPSSDVATPATASLLTFMLMLSGFMIREQAIPVSGGGCIYMGGNATRGGARGAQVAAQLRASLILPPPTAALLTRPAAPPTPPHPAPRSSCGGLCAPT
jgi:hypothetical protein